MLSPTLQESDDREVQEGVDGQGKAPIERDGEGRGEQGCAYPAQRHAGLLYRKHEIAPRCGGLAWSYPTLWWSDPTL